MEACKMLSTSIMVTDYCTLNCKLCLAYIPYLRERKRLSLAEAKIVFYNYFSMVDHVDKFSITGGEPFTNTELVDILLELLKYRSRISEIIIITNGTIKLPDEFLEVASKERQLKVIVNNYGSISKFAGENRELLGKHGITNILYDDSNRYDWVDCRDHSLKNETESEIKAQAASCVFFQGKKYLINHGKLYTCTRSWYRIENNLIPYSKEDYIKLTEKDFDVEKSREKLLNLMARKYSTSCAYCSGRTEKSILYPAAEQLTKGD